MGVNERTIGIIVLGAVAGAAIIFVISKYGANRSKNNFTRTCLTADTNCQFVRSPVDFAYKTMTEIPEKVGMPYPHQLGSPNDKLQPLENGRIDLTQDEMKLWKPELLWEQYSNTWGGCGNNDVYIQNDEKTRFSLIEVGDAWAWRQLNSESGPRFGPKNVRYPAITEADITTPEPYERLYGGSKFLPEHIGD